MTQTEITLWRMVRDRRLAGHKFVRQCPIGPYIADFVCREAMLVIELDGSQHIDSARDAARDLFLLRAGYRVLRFWNDQARSEAASMRETILAAIDGTLAPFERYKISDAETIADERS